MFKCVFKTRTASINNVTEDKAFQGSNPELLKFFVQLRALEMKKIEKINFHALEVQIQSFKVHFLSFEA